MPTAGVKRSEWLGRLLAVWCVLALVGCSGGSGGAGSGLALFLISIPQGMQNEVSATWRIAIMSELAPFTITYDFGGGAVPNTGTVTAATSQAEVIVKMRNPSSQASRVFNYQFTVADASGDQQTKSGSYTLPRGLNVPPVIDEHATHFDPASGLLLIYATDADGDALTAKVSAPAELTVEAVTPDPADAALAAYRLSAEGVFTPELQAQVQITVTDTKAEADTLTLTVTLPAREPLPDTLYAIPQLATTVPGVPVKILVVTGALSNPFRMMASVGVTVEVDASLIPGSFNAGDWGGEDYAPDGIWTAVAPHGFLLSPSDLPSVEPIGDGREVWLFHLFPDNGETTEGVQGALFNFELTFGQPGLKTIGLLAAYGGINRSYYADNYSTEYFWVDLSNEHTGIPNTVLIQ